LATLESMVLLKNEDILPLQTGKKIVVIGPHGKARDALVGNYLGQLCPKDGFDCVQSPLEAITEFNKNGAVVFEQGCQINVNDTSGFAAALTAAKQADYIVLLMGIDQNIEAEDRDRASIDLPYIQHELIALLMKLNKPTVLVLLNGGMLAIQEEKSTVPAILEAGYPGMFGAKAIAMTLFGLNDHLGGKLPYTLYPADYVKQVKMSYMEMSPSPGVSPGRTYRYYSGPTIYPFGYGISLTNFSLTPSVYYTATINSFSDVLAGSITVKNIGNKIGDEVVMIFVKPQKQTNAPWLTKLTQYKRVHLAPGESQTVAFQLSGKDFASAHDKDLEMVFVPGSYDVVFSNGVKEGVAFVVKVQV